PRESEILFYEWPRDPLRHIRMRPIDFLQALAETRPAASRVGGPPSPQPPAGDGGEGDGIPPADGGEAPPVPGAEGSPPKATRTIVISTLDGRSFRCSVPADMPISAVAGQFVRRH